MGRPKGAKNKPKTNQMITLKLTKQEFGLLTEWSKYHFWNNTKSFQDDIDIDELLGWSRGCLLMARLKAIADDQGIHFGYDDFPTEDMAPAAVKTDRVTQLFIDSYSANLANLAKQRAKENG